MLHLDNTAIAAQATGLQKYAAPARWKQPFTAAGDD
jgi:hypothetical protein